jgi:predicted permease
MNDLKFAFRQLLKNAGFTAVALISLGLGIGCTVTVFTLVHAVLLRKLPVRSPDQLVAIGGQGRNLNLSPTYFSHPFYRHLRDSQTNFSELIATSVAVSSGVNWRKQDVTERVRVEIVSGNYFEVLGVSAAIGRVLTRADDETPGAHPVVVLSHTAWQRHFGGAQTISGQTIWLNGHAFTIIGVAPDGFFGTRPGLGPDFWAPIMMVKAFTGSISPDQPNQNYLEFMARLRPGVKRREAEAALAVAHQQWLDAEFGQGAAKAPPLDGARLHLTPAPRGLSLLRGQYGQPLIILMAAVSLLFVISCANVAILLLARSSTRAKEFAIRLALGAARRRVARQLIAENLLLSLLGGGIGLGISVFLGRVLVTFLPATADTGQFAPDAGVSVFTLVVSTLTGLVFGLASARAFTRTELVRGMKGETALRSGRMPDIRSALSAAQVALSMMLVVGAGLFLRTLQNLKSVDLGFRRDHLALASLDPAKSGYDRNRLPAYWDQLLDRIRQQPGVEAASLATHGSLSGILPVGTRFISTSMHAEGLASRPGEDNTCYINFVAPAYFGTLGMRLLRGRDFNQSDQRNSANLAIVNETAARFFFKGDNAVGKRIGRGRAGPTDLEIVGLVNDAKYLNVREPALPTVYVLSTNASPMTLYVRASGDAPKMIALIQREARELDANVPLFNLQTMTARVDESLREERLVLVLASLLGVLGTLLAAVGLYGVLSYTVIQRTREIGIRMALGAQQSNVLAMALRRGMTVAGIGIVFGILGSLGFTRLAGALLYGVSPTDVPTFTVVTLLLTTIALIACWFPAYRASNVDPIQALHYE